MIGLPAPSDLRARRAGRATQLRRGSLSALREGRVVLLSAHTPAEGRRPSAVTAEVLGHSGRHLVQLNADRWSCSCSTPSPCSHVVAVRLVSGDVVDLEAVSR